MYEQFLSQSQKMYLYFIFTFPQKYDKRESTFPEKKSKDATNGNALSESGINDKDATNGHVPSSTTATKKPESKANYAYRNSAFAESNRNSAFAESNRNSPFAENKISSTSTEV